MYMYILFVVLCCFLCTICMCMYSLLSIYLTLSLCTSLLSVSPYLSLSIYLCPFVRMQLNLTSVFRINIQHFSLMEEEVIILTLQIIIVGIHVTTCTCIIIIQYIYTCVHVHVMQYVYVNYILLLYYSIVNASYARQNSGQPKPWYYTIYLINHMYTCTCISINTVI